MGLHIHRYRILGTRHDIPRLVREYRVDQVIIAIPSAPGRVIRDIQSEIRNSKFEIRNLTVASSVSRLVM